MTASHPLPISELRAHPANPNRLTGRNRRILARHLERAGRCPPIIVRPHPTETDRYEIIDGHHRAAIARELGWTEIEAVIWHASDAEANLLLATLNRLHGEDDPAARARLFAELEGAFDTESLRALVPESPAELRALERLLQPPSIPAPPPGALGTAGGNDEAEPLETLIILLPRPDRARVERALRAIDPRDTGRALCALIDLIAPLSLHPELTENRS